MVFRAVLLVLLAGAFSDVTQASTTHEIRFVQSANILVWQDGGLIGQGREVSVFETESATVRPVIGSGTLMSGASDRTSALNGLRLSIASNSGFTIETDTPDTSDRVTVYLVSQGPNAQAATRVVSAASGIVFHQTQKTAHQPGAPESQALHLEITWTGPVRPTLRIRAMEH